MELSAAVGAEQPERTAALPAEQAERHEAADAGARRPGATARFREYLRRLQSHVAFALVPCA